MQVGELRSEREADDLGLAQRDLCGVENMIGVQSD